MNATTTSINDKIETLNRNSRISNATRDEPLFGIDTIKIGFTVSEREMNLDGWKRHEWAKVQETGDHLISITYIKHHYTPNGTPITLKYLPYDYQLQPIELLLIEFSLPRLFFGTNSQNIRNWQGALDFANIQIKNIPDLPPLGDIRDATLYRLDICVNFQVGINDIGDYLQVMSRCYYPRRKTTSYLETGAVFSAKKLRTSIYDKYKESGIETTKGCMRMEIQFNSRREVGNWLKEEYPTLHSISLRLIAERFLKELSILKLDSSVICDQLEVGKALAEKFSATKVRSMLGYWLLKRTMTREQMMSNGYTRSSISRLEKKFKDAGISSNSTPSKKTLPSLIPFFPNIEKICNKPLSDTRVDDTSGLKKLHPERKLGKIGDGIFTKKNNIFLSGKQTGPPLLIIKEPISENISASNPNTINLNKPFY